MISFERVTLLECVVSDVVPSRKLRYEPQLTKLNRSVSEDGSVLKVLASFDLLGGVEAPACTLRCTFEATYSGEVKENFDSIKDHVAIAHLIPFVREFVWNVTSRLPITALMIPPIQTHRMVDDYKKRTAEKPVSSSAECTV